MARLVVTGAASPLGAKVLELMTRRDDVDSVVGVDLLPVVVPGAETEQLDLATADLGPVFAGADCVIHLASVFGPTIGGPEVADAVDVTLVRRVLTAAGDDRVSQVVHLSSATVYGAWANNTVPLTEEAPLRPNPELAGAVQKAEAERLIAEWSLDHPDVPVARLRPAPVVLEEGRSWLTEALDAAAELPVSAEPPAQYLHVDDLASAVVAAWEARLDGPVNVAPDGWLTPTERRALDPVPRVRLPERLAVTVSTWRWRLGLAPTHPGVLAYARHPWVVANDRLTATGWRPTHSNEEAYVVGHDASLIESISPQRRQELALGAAAGVLAAVGAGVFALVRRRLRRRA